MDEDVFLTVCTVLLDEKCLYNWALDHLNLHPGNFHDVESDVMEVEKWCLD